MNFNQTFTALLMEAQFTKEILGAGATQIRKANYAQKGIYFQAFTSLSTGLERIGKLCLMLDYYIENDGNFPDFKYLKNEISHKIDLLYQKSEKVIKRRAIDHKYCVSLRDEVHQNILSILSAFAVGDRYSNINILVNAHNSSDPIADWFTKVDVPLLEKRVSNKKKTKIVRNAKMLNEMAGDLFHVMHTSETGSEITDFEDASIRTGTQKAVAPYRQLYVIQIIRYWVSLLWELQYEAMSVNNQDIPYFSEIFGGFYNADSYIKTRKTWDTI